MLKKLGYFFSLLLIFALSVEAKSLLYKVSSEGSDVYILGSIHLAKPELYPLDNEITKAYTASDVLVLELDPSSQESVKTIQNSMLSLGMYPAGKNLKNQLSTKTYTALETYMSKVNLSLDGMQQMKPWVVMLQLSVMEMMRLGYSPELGIDQHFLNKAKQDKKPVVELETAAEQMALLAKDDKEFQDKLLFYTLESMHDLEPMLDDMFKYWKNGEAKDFEKVMSKSLEDDPSLEGIYDDLITKRNHTMAAKIEDFLKTNKNYFIVVGAGHVVGEEGIVSLLQKQGYELSQH